MISRRGLIVVALIVPAGCTSPPESLPPPVRFAAPIAENRVLGTFAISPDGQWLAYSAETATDRNRRIFVRSLSPAAEQDFCPSCFAPVFKQFLESHPGAKTAERERRRRMFRSFARHMPHAFDCIPRTAEGLTARAGGAR